MVRYTLKILQHMLHDFQSVSDYFMTLQSKGLSCNDPSKLVPYSFEPLDSSNNEDSDSKGKVQKQSSSNSRIGNIKWCKYNNCWQMKTDTENFCYVKADEIHKDMFEDKLTISVFLIPHSMPHSFKIYILITPVSF